MNIINSIIKKNYNELDDPSTTLKRRKIIKKKYFLYNNYLDFYKRIYDAISNKNKNGVVVELGSGAGFIKKMIPNAITSDILKLQDIDMHFSALSMPFKEKSVNAFVMIDVFHHINNVEKFLNEASRCLKKEGQIIMIEPSSSLFGKFIWKYFHHEKYDQNTKWEFEYNGPLSSSNSALPWIVFFRDKQEFIKKFPKLNIVNIETHSPFIFILSGGFSYPQLLPNFLLPLIKFFEILIKPLNSVLGLFYTINIIKK